MINKIDEVFRNKKSRSATKFRESAVVILLTKENDEYNIIFEVRALDLKNQPGDVCFPGGKLEEGESPKDAAIRETVEELNVKYEDIDYIGEMDYFVSPYGLIIHPFIAKIDESKNIKPNLSEVDHIFKVPLKFFIENEPELYEIKIGPIDLKGFPFHLIHGGENYKFGSGVMKEYFYRYNEYVIWGFTAQVIKSFVELLK